MARLLQPHLLSLSKTQGPFDSIFRTLFWPHGRNSRVTEIVRGRVGLLPNENKLYGFRTFCTSEDLTTKKCVPCNAKEMRPMAEESAHHLIPKVEGWNLVKEDGILKLNRSWKVKSFTKGMDFFKFVANVAEAEGHHPDLHLVGWNNVKIEIWTHAVGGLTENDFILAAKINKLDLHHLLRKKVSA
ncbi:pterin-4-alpha-carbinolamine dehydratase 2, mitochondrial-like [Mangifera indica]|uniref:pterin-4-alpha-carbinolamine dehydratase 2, mitochondrial-like n=1 Tax=Mangifera indica TaxID=29780 RepID=UPI001CF93B1C|nr:pterin-4-alpha-carbinolamine dehydratase 2, mitochondrial-like [Mangifera indica]